MRTMMELARKKRHYQQASNLKLKKKGHPSTESLDDYKDQLYVKKLLILS